MGFYTGDSKSLLLVKHSVAASERSVGLVVYIMGFSSKDAFPTSRERRCPCLGGIFAQSPMDVNAINIHKGVWTVV